MQKHIIIWILTIFFPHMIEADTGKASSPIIPISDFFKNPSEVAHSISPKGDFVAFLKPWNTRMNIFIQKIGAKEHKRVTSVSDRDIPGFFWANNDQLTYTLDSGGDENFHIFIVDRDGSNLRDLTPHEDTRASVIDDLPQHPNHMLIQHNHRDKRVFDAYRVDLTTGDMELVLENPGNYTSFLADHEGKLRLVTSTDGVSTSILYRDTEEQQFQIILTTNFKESVDPLFFTYDNKSFYASSNLGRDKKAIVIFDPIKTEESEVIFQHPQVDVSNLLRSDKRKVITGVSFTAARRGYQFFDEERRSIQEWLEQRLDGLEVSIASVNLNEDKYLIRSHSDRDRGSYYFYDHVNKTLQHLVDVSPWIKSEHMSPMRPVVYQSRDGIIIHGYLTLPLGVSTNSLPTVVLPHGGPWARDTWGFRPDVQFLANRGYAVFQINFRGSTGYGRQFWEMSFKEWGRAMQDDITDGVNWLINRGISDPERIGIFGASYGGYVVLAGLAFTPDLYACGVDYVGVSNLFTILETIPPYWEPMREMMYEMMGHPEADSDLLRSVSPVFHADKIKVPLLIAQGANDPRVKKSESDQMVAAMRKKGVEVPYMIKENEGHGFRNEENRFDVYRAMEQFFHKNLGGRSDIGHDLLGTLN